MLKDGKQVAAILEAYKDAILDTDRDAAMSVVQRGRASGMSPEQVVFDVVVPAIASLMTGTTDGEGVSLAQHYMTAQIGSEVVEEMIPLFASAPVDVGRVVMGTAPGDFHGLGKRIVGGCLRAMMVDVVDLGLNVPAHRFVDEAVARDAQVIAISSMMVHTARGRNGCLKVREILRERRLEERIKIAVGGAPFRFDPGLARTVEADGWAEDGITAGRVITRLIQEVRT
jgi:methanogenic corrinoid protein MtbC1